MTREGDSGAAKEISRRANDLQDWQTAISSTFLPLTVRPIARGQRFHGSITAHMTPTMRLASVRAGGHVIESADRRGTSQSSGTVMLATQVSGTSIIAQDGHEVILKMGDWAVFDLGRDFTVTYESEFATRMAMFARSRLHAFARTPAPLGPVRFGSENPAGSLGAAAVASVFSSLSQDDRFLTERLCVVALDVLDALVENGVQDDAVDRTDHGARVKAEADAYIEEHLSEMGLCAAQIAAALFVSVRSLQEVFRSHGDTVTGEIRSRRLEHCRADLLSPLRRSESIGEIATRWGFSSPSAFSRLFGAVYGVTPSDARRRG